MIATKAFRLGLCAALLAAVACTNTPSTITVVVTPSSVTVQTGATQQFTASVVGTSITDVTWSLEEGAAAGTLTSSGLYTAPSTLPATGGTFHVVATSQADATKQGSAQVTVLMPSPVQTIDVTPSAAALKTNATYQFTAVINGNPSTAVTWSVASGGVGGTISASGLYTAPSATGRDAVTATATADPTRSATAAVTVTLQPAPVLNYVSNKLTCIVGTPCSLSAPSNSGGPYLSLAVSPALPAGLSLDPTTGAISGTPTAVAASAVYSVLATNAGGTGTTQLTITVNAIAPSALSYGSNFIICTVNTACPAVTPTNAGGAATGFTITPALPAGLSINPTTGAISGTPTMITPSSAYVVTATNSGGKTSAAVNVAVIDNPPATVTYKSTSLTCTIGVPCGLAAPTTTGGAVTNYSVSPALPDGLSIDPVTGAISGSPTTITPGALYVVLASNTGGSVIVDLNIAVNDLPPTGLTYTNNTIACTKGTPCALPAPTHGGGTVTGFSVSPALPAGLVIDPNSGAVTGTPTVVSAKAPYVVTASNSGGQSTATINITVNDTAPTALVYNPSTGSCTETVFCSFGPPTSSGGKVTTYSISPALPAGLNLNPSTGLITGTALSVSPSTNYVVKAANSGGSTTTTINFTVLEAAPRSLTYSPNALVCSQNVPCSLGAPHNDGGQIDTYTISPALPKGLAINATTGAITGTASVTSPATTYTVTGTNSVGSTTATVSVTVNGPPTPPPADLLYTPAALTCQVNVACGLAAPTQDGGAVTSYTVAPALPAGLSIDPATGAVSGTPTAPSAATSYTVTAANSGGSATAAINIVVYPAGPWTALGPPGGLAMQLVVSADSNTLFAVMQDHTVYRSVDAGAHWAFANTGLQQQGVDAVSIDPTTPGAVYAALSSNGYAISLDNGNSWSVVGPNGLDGISIAADPFTAGTFYGGAAQSGTVLYKSTDRGTTINPSQGSISEAQSATVVADPVTQNLIYAITPGNLYVSHDGGSTWTESDIGLSGLLGNLAIDPAAPANLYVASQSSNGVFYSTDAGATWQFGSAGIPQAATGVHVFVDPSLHTRIYLSTSAGSFVSADSGADWAAFSVTPASANVVAVAPNGTVYATDASGIYSTSNGGLNWSPKVAGLTATEMLSVAVSPNGTLFAAGNTGTYRSTDNGSTWTLLDPSPSAQVVVDPKTDAVLRDNVDGSAFVSTDNGSTWTAGPANVVVTLSIAPTGSIVFAGFSSGGVQKSTDDGVTFTDSSQGMNAGNGQPFITSIAFSADASKLVAVSDGTVYHSTDGGQTWSQSSVQVLMPSLVRFGETFRATAYSPSNGLFYVAGDRNVYVSSDGGATFTMFYSLGGGTTSALAVNPSNGEVYVDASSALLSISADGSTQSNLNAGLTSYNVDQIVSTGALLYVATYGGGVLVSAVDGQTPNQPAAVSRSR